MKMPVKKDWTRKELLTYVKKSLDLLEVKRLGRHYFRTVKKLYEDDFSPETPKVDYCVLGAVVKKRYGQDFAPKKSNGENKSWSFRNLPWNHKKYEKFTEEMYSMNDKNNCPDDSYEERFERVYRYVETELAKKG